MDPIRITNNRAQTRPLTPPSTAPLSAPPGKAKPGVLGTVADVFVGGGEAIADMAKGLYAMIRHPIQTVKGIGFLITKIATDPIGGGKLLAHAFIDPYTKAIAEGHPGKAVGRGIVEIGSLFITPGDVAGAFKATATGATGAVNALRAGGSVTEAAKSASLAVQLSSQTVTYVEKAASLTKLGYVAEAGKMDQLARVTGRVAEMAKAGEAARAARWVTVIDGMQHLNVGTKVMSLADMMTHADKLLELGKAATVAGTAAGRLEQGLDKAATKAAGQGVLGMLDALPGAERLTQLAGRAAQISPFLLLSPQVAMSMGLLNAAVPIGQDVAQLTPERAKAIAAQYGLAPSLENVKAFLGEASHYGDGAVGPGSDPVQVKQIQLALRVAGYDVAASGKFDEATALAVVHYKQANGLHQGYAMADGKPAVNEYVDGPTAEALFAVVNRADRTPEPAAATAEQQAVAKRFGLAPDAANVKAFQSEVASYASAVGPDSKGSPVVELQGLLKRLGYKVSTEGAFDDATAEAVIAFKKAAGMHQGYKLANGDWAINEYVDAAAMLRMRAALFTGKTP